jgi:general stress protein 26
MPGYGIGAADGGRGLLPWSWAEERLAASHDYWVTTVGLDGAPHVMPVWGVWLDDAVWFSSSTSSRRVRNLRAEPRCALATNNPWEPVVVEGVAEVVGDRALIATFLEHSNRKYETSYDTEFLDPTVNATVRVRPSWAFSLTEDDFTGSATRWHFE